jgi:low affinity Fe/Cu permease
MAEFLFKLGYTIEVIKIQNDNYDEKCHSKDYKFMTVSVAYKDDEIDELIKSGSHELCNKVGLEEQFRKEIKNKLLN